MTWRIFCVFWSFGFPIPGGAVSGPLLGLSLIAVHSRNRLMHFAQLPESPGIRRALNYCTCGTRLPYTTPTSNSLRPFNLQEHLILLSYMVTIIYGGIGWFKIVGWLPQPVFLATKLCIKSFSIHLSWVEKRKRYEVLSLSDQVGESEKFPGLNLLELLYSTSIKLATSLVLLCVLCSLGLNCKQLSKNVLHLL